MTTLLLFALIILSQASPRPTPGEQASASPTPPAYGEKELKDAQIEREKAQAEYYRAEATRLQAPAREKTLWQSISENPASALGVIGAFLTALFAAAVGLLNLFVNNRTALRAQRDTQFYEALKRFGDKDSAAVRSSAAAILAQMAIHETTEFNYRHPSASTRKKVFPYFATAWNQLITGMLLDEEIVVLIRISEAVEEVIEAHPNVPIDLIRNANVKLQEDIRISLINLFITLGATDLENVKDESWAKVSPLVSYWERDLLRYMIENRMARSKSLFRSHLLDYMALPEADKPSHMRTVSRRLQLSGYRLYQNINVFSLALKHHPIVLTQVHKNPLFLPGASLQGTDLRKADMKRVILTEAKLRRANLQEAHLQGARLVRTDVEDTKLWGAHVNERTSFRQTKWWEADFSRGGDLKEVDLKLLEELFSRYSEAIPSDLTKVHPSAREFISERQKNSAAVVTG